MLPIDDRKLLKRDKRNLLEVLHCLVRRPSKKKTHKQEEAPQMSHQILDSLEGYLYNIAASATQTAANGVPVVELADSLAVSVDTVAKK